MGGGGGRGVREGPRRGKGGGCTHVVCTCRLYPAKRVESITSPLFLISMNHDTQRETEGGRDRQTETERQRQTETERQRAAETVTVTETETDRQTDRDRETDRQTETDR